MKLKVKVLGGELPSYESVGASGLDLKANIAESIVLKPMERTLVPTGIAIELPVGYEAQVRGRSGIAIKNGIGLVNGIGTIDSDYRGEIKVILINWGEEDYTIDRGQRIAQMVISKFEKIEMEVVQDLEETKRGEGGFGHSGK